MKKLFRVPFLCLMVLSMLVAMPFLWREMGLLDAFTPQSMAADPVPTVIDPELTLSQADPVPGEEPPAADPSPQDPALSSPSQTEPDPSDTSSGKEPPSQPEPSETSEPSQPSGEGTGHVPDPTNPRSIEAENDQPVHRKPPENPFENALFIGDSRTVGIAKYSGITEADFFATTGMDVYSVFTHESTTGSWEKGTLLENVLREKQYDRIYIMLGINELGYNFKHTVETYSSVLDRLRQLQPDAVLIVEANLQVSKTRSETDKVINRDTIQRMNEAQAGFADDETVFYMDVNPLFCDEEGYLDASLSFDGTHPYGKYYARWAEWLKENTPA